MTMASFDDDYIRGLLRAFTHDLRNPLVNMQVLTLQMQEALAELQKRGVEGDELVEIDESLTMMTETVGRMNGLVDGGYRLSRAMYLIPESADVALRPMILELLELRQTQLQHCRVDISMVSETSVRTDAAGIQRIVTELLDNAIRHVPGQGGEIVISAKMDVEGLQLTCSNNGAEIPVSEREQIFDPFFTNEAGHHGLGLAMVRALAQAQGGRAWCDSPAGGGASFHLTIPCSVR